ncbi:MAG: ribbon-helix-helix domain-containing protein [Verrucomicrobiales bacterium]|jgi:predicted DNA-binding protein|nr:ribbon-helix-helix domain-containing protein [Verrucomicrobiales bacterium]
MKKRPTSKPLKDALVSARVPSQLKERLRAVEKRTRVTSSVMLEEALEAICDYVEQTEEIRLPFRLIPDRELAFLHGQINNPKNIDVSA